MVSIDSRNVSTVAYGLTNYSLWNAFLSLHLIMQLRTKSRKQ